MKHVAFSHIKAWEHVLAELGILSLPLTSFWLSKANQLTFFVLFLRKAKGEFAYKLNGAYGELCQGLLLR